MDKKRNMSPSKVALYGVLIALAMILSYVETLIPISLGIPGVKPGLANLVVIVAMYVLTPRDAFFISMIRIVLVGFTFGNMSAMMYSFAGGLLSFAVMFICKKKNLFGVTGVSICGGVSHNIGQLLIAALVVENGAVFFYLPVLLLAGSLTGALIGLLGGMAVKRLPRDSW